MKIICSNCGELRKHQAFGLCKKCYMRIWQKEHPEKTREYDKKRYNKDKEKRKAKSKKWAKEQ